MKFDKNHTWHWLVHAVRLRPLRRAVMSVTGHALPEHTGQTLPVILVAYEARQVIEPATHLSTQVMVMKVEADTVELVTFY